MTAPLPPGGTIGILGGGQLGRMSAMAAARLGYRCHVFAPEADTPGMQVAAAATVAPYEDEAALRAFADSVDVITYEFENVPTSALDLLESLRPIRPGRRALAVSQDRLTEKTFLTEIGLTVAPFADVRDMGGLLQRAGFALPVADSEALTVRYDHLFALMADLRAMGATSTLTARDRRPARRAMFLRAAELYAGRFADADGRIRATFEIVSLAGWAPQESQPRPARRGSGTVNLADALRDRTDRLL